MQKTEEILLLPNEILTEERFNIRPFSTGKDGDGEQETAALESLADSIDTQGQLYPGLVVPKLIDGKERYVIYGGHRRRRAIILLNQRRSRQFRPNVYMRVQVDRTGKDIELKCIQDNVQRQNLSAMDLALLIQRLRVQKSWPLAKHNELLANYLGVSPAQITQTEKFCKANVHLQKMLHNGIVSADTAFKMIGLSEAQQDEVLQRVAENQLKNGPTETEETDHETQETSETQAQRSETKPKRIQQPAIVKAMRELNLGGPMPRTRKNVVEFFESLDGPAYGEPSSDSRQFIAAIGKWLAGEINDTQLTTAFDNLAGTIEISPSNLIIMPVKTESIHTALQA